VNRKATYRFHSDKPACAVLLSRKPTHQGSPFTPDNDNIPEEHFPFTPDSFWVRPSFPIATPNMNFQRFAIVLGEIRFIGKQESSLKIYTEVEVVFVNCSLVKLEGFGIHLPFTDHGIAMNAGFRVRGPPRYVRAALPVHSHPNARYP